MGFNEKLIYLTTIGRKTGKEHTVEIWFAHDDGRVYLSHEGDYTDWMKNIVKNRNVKFRIGRTRYAGKARIIADAGRMKKAKRVLYFKYYGPASEAKLDDWFELSTLLEIYDFSNES